MFKKLLVLFTLGLLVACAEAQAGGPTAACPYQLPWPDYLGKIRVSQGQFEGSHTGESQYALDFDFAGGEPIIASRIGIVSAVHDGETVCGGWEVIDKANFVIIDHLDGTFSAYVHLKPGIAVTLYQAVERGTLLGYAGNTGWTDCQTSAGRGYHLHFQLQSLRDRIGSSVPVCFEETADRVPQRDDWLVSLNRLISVPGMQVETPTPAAVPTTAPTGKPSGQISYLVFEGSEVESGEIDESKGGFKFVVYDLKTGEETVKYLPLSPFSYAWSPDGTKLVTSFFGAFAYVDYETGVSSPVFEPLSQGIIIGFQPAVWANSPYGEAIFLDCRVAGMGHGVCYVNPPSSEVKFSPAEGPEDWLVFSASANGSLLYGEYDSTDSLALRPKMLLFESGTGSSKEVEVNFEFIFSPKLSPQGDKIAFLAQSEETLDIWVMDIDGGNLKRLTQTRGETEEGTDFASAFSWSNDGAWIVFERGYPVSLLGDIEGGLSDIWIVNVITGEMIQITDTPDLLEMAPAWKP